VRASRATIGLLNEYYHAEEAKDPERYGQVVAPRPGQRVQGNGGVAIFESVGTWHLYDSSEISVKACSVSTVVDGKFTD
jgi:hypothetical protein